MCLQGHKRPFIPLRSHVSGAGFRQVDWHGGAKVFTDSPQS